MKKIAQTLVGIIALTSSAFATELKPINHDLVLTSKESIEAKLPYGNVTIKALTNTLREYTWDEGECKKSQELLMRTTPWNNVEGGYNPATILSKKIEMCNGIGRLLTEEGYANFQNVSEFQTWFNERYSWLGDEVTKHVKYTKEGLLVAYQKKIPERYQTGIEVIQILINGEIPTDLPDSEKENLILKTNN